MSMLLPLCRRDGSVKAYAVVDAADFADVSRFRWHLASTGYATRKIPNGNKPGGRASLSPSFNAGMAYKSDQITLHRYLMGLQKGDPREVDHINRDKLDYRRENLRVVASRADNMQNVAAIGGTSRHRGVCFDRVNQKWTATVVLRGRSHWLGRHATEQAAADAASAFRREHMPFSDDARQVAI